MRLFKETAPNGMLNSIDMHMNCEDIALNMVASNFCRCAATFKTRLIRNVRVIGGSAGLHNRQSHTQRRSDCINEFAKYFDVFPLKFVDGKCFYGG